MARNGLSILLLMALLLIAPLAGVAPAPLDTGESGYMTPSWTTAPRASGDLAVEVNEGDWQEGDIELTRNETHSYEFLVDNTGVANDTYNLSVSWEDDGNAWQFTLDQTNVSVAAGASVSIYLTISAPRSGVYADDMREFNVTATSITDPAVSDNGSVLIRIITPYAVDMMPPKPEADSGTRGATITYEVDIINVGSNTDSYDVTFARVPWDWTATLNTNSDLDDVASNEMRTFSVDVEIPDNAEANEFAYIRITVTSQGADYSYDIDGEAWCNTSVTDGRTYGLTIETDDTNLTVTPGNSVSYQLTVTNTGDEDDTYSLSATPPPEGWEVALDPDRLIDVGPGEARDVSLTLTAPADAAEGEWVLVTAEGYSELRDHHRASLETNTSVRIPVRYVDLASDAPGRSGDPFDEVVYLLTVYNNGTDVDDYKLNISAKPAQWQVTLDRNTLTDVPNGSSATVTLRVTVPGWAQNTHYAMVRVGATSLGNSSLSDEVETNTTVNTLYGFSVDVDVKGYQRILNPGNATRFNFTLTNQGNGVADFDFVHTQLPREPDWASEWSPASKGLDGVAPRVGTGRFSLTITVPVDAEPMWGNFTVIIVVRGNSDYRQELPVSIRVVSFAALKLETGATDSSDEPGAVHTFDLFITNQGNELDTFDLVYEGLPEAWSARFLHLSLPVDSVTLVPSQTVGVQLEVTTDIGDLPGASALTVTIISQLNPLVSREAQFTVGVDETHGLEVTIETSEKSTSGNESIPFQFIIRNLGNTRDHVSVAPPTGLQTGWSVSSRDTFTLDAFDSELVTITVTTPKGVWGGRHPLTLKINSDTGTYYLEVALTVEVVRSLELELTEWPGEVRGGATGSFTVKATNRGNAPEVFDLGLMGKRAGWFTPPPSTLGLDPGESTIIELAVTVPAGEPARTVTVTFNATYQADAELSMLQALKFNVPAETTTPNGNNGEEEGSSLLMRGIVVGAALTVLVTVTLVVMRLRR